MAENNENDVKKKPSKRSLFKEIGKAMKNTSFGFGGAGMANIQPAIQQKVEQHRIIDQTAEATGLDPDVGLLKNNAVYAKEVANNLKQRGIAVKDEYKEKHKDVFSDEGSKANGTKKTEEKYYVLKDVLRENDNDPKKVREWLTTHPSYQVGEKTKKWLEDNPVIEKEEGKTVEKGKKTLKDLKGEMSDEQDKDAVDDSQLIENITATQKKGESDYDDMAKIVEKFNEKSSNIDDYYKENLPKTLWRMYKDGDLDGTTGDKKKDKRLAKERLGYFILNGLGTGLVNASLVARGSAPAQESDLVKMRREKLEGALDRYNKKRDETMTKSVEQLGLNSELLNKFNIDLDALKNNKIFDEVAKSLDRKGMKRTIKAYALAGNYLEGLTDQQKSNLFMAIMALNSNDGKSAGVSYLVSTLGKPLADEIMGMFED